MLTAATRRVSETMLQRARITREPLFAVADLETFQLAPVQN
jgi:hypothetical protein